MATTADDVWRLLGELVEAQTETERRSQETERQLQKTAQENWRTNQQLSSKGSLPPGETTLLKGPEVVA